MPNNIHYEWTTDNEFITKCLTHPSLWRLGTDDAMIGVNPNIFFPPIDGITYVKAGNYGLLIGVPVNHITLDVHVALLPEAKGKAVDISKSAIKWIFDNSDKVLRLIASIPQYNHLAIKLAEKVGMELIGTNSKSFMKNGVLYDQLLFGISKGV